MAKPSIVRCVRVLDYVPFARVAEPIMIQGARFLPPTVLIDSETPGNILTNSEAPTILVDSEGN